jgi:3-hydroxybutyryl-CoA dehydrogenase
MVKEQMDIKLTHAAEPSQQLMSLKKVAVIGAGTMGNGICHVFAQNGFNVHMVDVSQEALDKALIKIGKNMDRQIAKNTLDEAAKVASLALIVTYTDL